MHSKRRPPLASLVRKSLAKSAARCPARTALLLCLASPVLMGCERCARCGQGSPLAVPCICTAHGGATSSSCPRVHANANA